MTFFKAFFYFIILILPTQFLSASTPVDILYSSDADIAGFQFNVDGVVITSASGGAATAAGFTISASANTVLGFSLMGATIPAGEGVLVVLEVEGDVAAACLYGVVISDTGGNALDATVEGCLTITSMAPVPGCTDMDACNYNAEAGVDDGSCEFPEENFDCDDNCTADLDCVGDCGGSAVIDECGVCGGSGIPFGECDCNGNVDDCAGDCGGSAVEDECGVCDGDGTSCMFVTLSFGAVTESSVEIWLDNPLEVAGFQFNISGLNITGASGGSAEDNGLMVSTSSNTVVGFSLSGAVIPIGDAVLTNLSFNSVNGDDICLSNAVISSDSGVAINYELGPCWNPSDYFNGGCTEEEACNYESDLDYNDGSCTYAEENFDCDDNCLLELDCAEVCGGSLEYDCANVCDGIAEIDCAGECGGSAVEDVCGECGGDGSSCSSTIEIFYDIDTPIAGFQFDIEGVEVVVAYGGDAEDAGFSISISGNTVIGNSLTGSLIPSGSGILVQVQINGIADPCLDNIIFSDNNENFESGFGSLGWDFSCMGLGCSNWDIDNTESNTGAGSAKSGSINDGQSSDMSITIDIAVDGEIEFYYRVSAEYSPSGTAFYDGLEFYIDNTLMGQYQSTGTGDLGSPWTYVGHNVTEGEHTFRWSYVKDGAGGATDCDNTACEDAAWVDDIVFTITPLGNELHDCLEVVINSGCTEIMGTCNYDSNATNNDGSCLENDCFGECGGSSVEDACGVCGGDGSDDVGCGCFEPGPSGCDNECGSNSEYDECGICGGDGSGCDIPQAALSFGDLGGDVMLQVSYTDAVGDICIVSPVISDAVGDLVSTIVGECILLESSGSLDIYLNSSIDVAGFQFGLSGLTITGASGGNAEANGFVMSTSASMVIGFSLTGSTIDANGSVGCMDESACNFYPDATIPGGCQYEVDCLDICGGMAEEDECGLCNGAGAEIECWDGELVCNAENCSDEPVFTDVDYLTEIQPILNANCTFYCHSEGGAYQGGLDLTSYENLMAGDSDHGPVVMPGDSENSILIQKLGDEPPFGDQMPQNGPPYLDAYTIALIAAWIDEGALPSDEPEQNTLSVNVLNETVEVYYTSQTEFAGFQFSVDGAEISGASGGAAEENGFMVSSSIPTVIGFSLSGATIPAGSGLLTILSVVEITGEVILFDIIVANSDGSALDFEFDDGWNEVVEGCMDPNADNYDPDATDDDGSCTYPPLGELTFGAIDYHTGTLEINLDCQYAVSSFVFELTGINITGNYGGTTEAAGFDISFDGSTVSGNSTADNIPANSGLLMVVNFDALTAEEICFGSSTITTFVGIEYEAILDECIIIEGGTTGGDDGGFGCDTGYVDDCSGDGDCCPESWIGDGSYCDGEDQLYGCDLTCYDNDGGDCATTNDLSIDLISGWNWISFNVNPEDDSLSSMLGSVGDDATFISSQSSGTAQNYGGDFGWFGALTELDPTQMYKLQMTAAANLVITGVPVDVASTPISLIAGWNWIGYLPQNAGLLDEALVSVGDDATFIASQSSGTAQNYGGDFGWFGALTTLEPGSGYLLDMSDAGTLTYPEFNSLVRLDANKQEVVLKDAISDWEFNYADYEFIGTIHASIESREDLDGDIAGVFVDDQCRGIAERMYFPFDDSYFYIVQVYSNIAEGEEMTFKYYDSTRDEVIEYGETMMFTSNMVVGDGFHTFSLSREVLPIPKEFSLERAYPNPFNPVTSFTYSLPEDGLVQVAIYDISGRMVSELVNGYQSAGSYPVVWDANELSSGVYLVNMISGEFTTVQKIMLIK